MGVKRRNFLIGAAAVAGAGVFGIGWADRHARHAAQGATVKQIGRASCRERVLWYV